RTQFVHTKIQLTFCPGHNCSRGPRPPVPLAVCSASDDSADHHSSSSARVMLSVPSRRPGKRPAPPGPEGGDGGGEADWISGLPDDLLHLVLVRLDCAREAARTSILARRWRRLWARLPEYTFWDMEPEEVETALVQVTRSSLDDLDIDLVLRPGSALDGASSLLRAAARLSSETVTISLYRLVEEDAAIELPCFDRTSCLILKLRRVPLAPPPPLSGEFSRLETLQLATGSNIFPGLLPSCPRLRVLVIHAYRELEEVTIHSATLEELAVQSLEAFSGIPRIDIDTPELKKSNLNVNMDLEFSLTFSAPKVEELVWTLGCLPGNVGLAELRLNDLNYSLRQGVRTLRLDIDYTYETLVPDRSFAEEIARLRVTDFSVLELFIKKIGHAFGPLMLDLLQIKPAIQRLKVVIERGEVEGEEGAEEESCPQNCPCRQPINWKSQTISLPDLEEVLISYDFEGGDDEEVDFLKLLFRCAPGLKSMHVGVRDMVYKKICSICKENPRVKCEVSHCYRRPGKWPAPPDPKGGDGDGDGEDRISGLPDDLLHLVLVRLDCTREAARTSILARRWRGLWTRLPEYTFFWDMEPEVVETALAQVTRSSLDDLYIDVVLKPESALDRASWLLRAAARLSLQHRAAAVMLPFFNRTTSLILNIEGMPIAVPPTGEFSRLESLELATSSNIFPALLHRCPCMRVLRINARRELEEVTVHSETLEELDVEGVQLLNDIRKIDINTPELKKMKFDVEMGLEFSVTVSAPKVEEVDWEFVSEHENIGLAIVRLFVLEYSLSQGVNTLRLTIDCMSDSGVPNRSFAEEIARLRVSDFSVFELTVETNGHAFGPLLLHLLQIQPAIQRLMVDLRQGKEEEFCTHNCTCRQPVNWENENISLADLEEVLISYNLEGEDEEVGFLKLLFRCAPGLKGAELDPVLGTHTDGVLDNLVTVAH
ncbi:hypothetical protein EJB05_12657, partial [Eragrostis curvula]